MEDREYLNKLRDNLESDMRRKAEMLEYELKLKARKMNEKPVDLSNLTIFKILLGITIVLAAAKGLRLY